MTGGPDLSGIPDWMLERPDAAHKRAPLAARLAEWLASRDLYPTIAQLEEERNRRSNNS